MNPLHPIDKHLLFTKNDKEDPRLGECVQTPVKIHPSDLENYDYDFALLGYPDDEGISLNGGRPGAQNAPRDVRQIFYKMTPHPLAKITPKILDLGDLIEREIPLKERHELARAWTAALAKKGKPWIAIGGGHDYGYVDGAGFLDQHGGQAVILNFDAHMDVRPLIDGINSGTSFYRLLTAYPGQFDFAEIGIQNQCNSKFHIQWAKEKNACVMGLEEIESKGLQKCLQDFLADKQKKKIFISVDIDAFNSMEAPGCSQSWTTGLRSQEFLTTLDWLVANFQVQALGLYEISPPLDADFRTSKLGALILHRFLFAHLQKVRP